ncbi:MAG TPA: hypothetical protein VK921_17125 [Anditalea sp.]|nr:hypothetical protein [Anditalea sp.]
MKNYILLFSSICIFISGCNREDPLPALEIEGVYIMVRLVSDEVFEEGDLPYENVYWFFADRTFQKVRFKDEVLIEATGTFSPVTYTGTDHIEGPAYELLYTTGDELIEGCYPDKEIIIQNTSDELSHLSASCGEPDIYYNKAIFN